MITQCQWIYLYMCILCCTVYFIYACICFCYWPSWVCCLSYYYFFWLLSNKYGTQVWHRSPCGQVSHIYDYFASVPNLSVLQFVWPDLVLVWSFVRLWSLFIFRALLDDSALHTLLLPVIIQCNASVGVLYIT